MEVFAGQTIVNAIDCSKRVTYANIPKCCHAHDLPESKFVQSVIWGRYLKSTSFAPHLFLLGWLKLNLIVRSVETGLGR